VKTGQGEGQVVDVSLVESVFNLMESPVPEYDLPGHVHERGAGALPGIAPSNTYRTKDGRFVVIAGNSDPIFRRLMLVVRFATLSRKDRCRGLRTARVGSRKVLRHELLDFLLARRGHVGHQQQLTIEDGIAKPSEARVRLVDPDHRGRPGSESGSRQCHRDDCAARDRQSRRRERERYQAEKCARCAA